MLCHAKIHRFENYHIIVFSFYAFHDALGAQDTEVVQACLQDQTVGPYQLVHAFTLKMKFLRIP